MRQGLIGGWSAGSETGWGLWEREKEIWKAAVGKWKNDGAFQVPKCSRNHFPINCFCIYFWGACSLVQRTIDMITLNSLNILPLFFFFFFFSFFRIYFSLPYAVLLMEAKAFHPSNPGLPKIWFFCHKNHTYCRERGHDTRFPSISNIMNAVHSRKELIC